MSNLADHLREQDRITEEAEEPQFTDAELAATEAETAALRAQLRRMAPPPASQTVHVATPASAPVFPAPHAPAGENTIDAADPRVTAALADRQARLDAMPKNRIAKMLIPLLNESWVQERHITDSAKPRDNDDRAVDGGIACSLTGMLSGSMTPVDQALDAMVNVMHFLRRNDMGMSEIHELTDMANRNFEMEVQQEELNRINVVQTRSAPAWAWAGIDAALERSAEGWRCGDDHAAMGVQNSIVGMRVATDTPGLAELVLDSLSGHPQFAEIEQPEKGEA